MTSTFQSSSFINYISCDILNGVCNVHLKNGACYRYTNVSRRALLNLTLNRRMSLGSWYNFNCLGGNATREVADERKLWQAFA